MLGGLKIRLAMLVQLLTCVEVEYRHVTRFSYAPDATVGTFLARPKHRLRVAMSIHIQ